MLKGFLVCFVSEHFFKSCTLLDQRTGVITFPYIELSVYFPSLLSMKTLTYWGLISASLPFHYWNSFGFKEKQGHGIMLNTH